MSIPTFRWEVAFGALPADASYTWVANISANVAENQFSRGKSSDLDRIEAGTGTVRILDDLGAFDPRYTASPWYPNVRPMVPIRQVATLDGVDYPLCLHYIETFGRARVAAFITRDLKTVDGFAILASAPLAGATLTGPTTGAHITAVLNYVGWPAGKRLISTGSATVVNQAFPADDGTMALPYMQEITSNEAGLLYMDGAGNVVFLDRNDLLGPPFNEIQAYFSDDPGDLTYVYEDATPSFGNERIFNDWTGTRPGGGVPQEASDATSINRYRRRAKQISTLYTNDGDVYAAMQHWMSYYMEPRERLQRIRVRPGEDSGLWRTLLGLEIGDRVTVTETMPYGAKYRDDYLIERVSLARAPGSDAGAVFEYALWPTDEAGAPSGLVFDDATLGLVGTGTMGW